MMCAMPATSMPSHVSIACVLQAMADGMMYRIELPLSPPWRAFASIAVTNTHGLSIDPTSTYALIVSVNFAILVPPPPLRHAPTPLQPDYNNGRLYQLDASSNEEVLLSVSFPASCSGIAIDPTGSGSYAVRAALHLFLLIPPSLSETPPKQFAILYTGGLYTYAFPRSGTPTTTQGPSPTQTLSTGSSQLKPYLGAPPHPSCSWARAPQ